MSQLSSCSERGPWWQLGGREGQTEVPGLGKGLGSEGGLACRALLGLWEDDRLFSTGWEDGVGWGREGLIKICREGAHIWGQDQDWTEIATKVRVRVYGSIEVTV